MWKKNALFLVCCLVGLGVLGGLFARDQVKVAQALRRQGSAVREGGKTTQLASSLPGVPSLVATIDGEFAADWTKRQVPPATPADRLTVVRRLSLALTGAIPSLEEVRAVETLPEDVAIERWTAYLLDDPRYFDYMAERFARAFVGTEDGPFIFFRRRRFVAWLSERLRRDARYDELVRELIADEGLWTDTPAVNFVTVTFHPEKQVPDPIRMAGRTSRAFLAQRLDCLQCHDDNLDKMDLASDGDRVPGTQRHFHELASFYGQATNTYRGLGDDPKRTYDCTFLGDDKPTTVEPKAPFGDEWFKAEGTRRQQLAAWVTHPKNEAFARATVNRVWAVMFGKPLVEPIDDIPMRGPYPPAMETLARDFRENGYDLKRLIQTIAATKAFRAASEVAEGIELEDEKLLEAEKAWAMFPVVRLRPEQVAGSVVQGASLRAIDADSNLVWKLVKFGNTQDFVTRYGDAGQDEFGERGGTIPQRLLLMNGQMVEERTSENIVLNASTRLSQLTRSDERAIEATYLTLLTRRPTNEEREHFAERFKGKSGKDRIAIVQDLYWTLLNSTEFSWNH